MEELLLKAANYALGALGKAGSKLLDKSLETLGDRVLGLLRSRLDDDLGKVALASAASKPDSAASEAMLKAAIQAKVEEMPDFAKELEELLKDAPPVVNQTINQTGSGNAAAQIVGDNNTTNIKTGD